jgi:hypothetical protein
MHENRAERWNLISDFLPHPPASNFCAALAVVAVDARASLDERS